MSEHLHGCDRPHQGLQRLFGLTKCFLPDRTRQAVVSIKIIARNSTGDPMPFRKLVHTKCHIFDLVSCLASHFTPPALLTHVSTLSTPANALPCHWATTGYIVSVGSPFNCLTRIPKCFPATGLQASILTLSLSVSATAAAADWLLPPTRFKSRCRRSHAPVCAEARQCLPMGCWDSPRRIQD